MKTAQRMVDAAAKKAGYTIGPVFHGSDKQFSVFDVSKIGQKHGRSEGAGFYFTTDRSTAEGYTPKGGTLYSVYLKVGKILDFDSKPFTPSQLKKLLKAVALQEQKDGLTDSWKDGFLSNYEDTYSMSLDSAVSKAVSYFESEKTALDQIGGIVGSGVDAATVNKALASSLGYDAFASKGFSGGGKSGGIIYVATSPSQIKSADPVTYDDAGNVIPLSQRFNDQTSDIRNPKQQIKRRLKKNPLSYPQDQVSAAHIGPANSDINAAKVLWDTPAFKKWFGESKVRDASRRPMVVYHGTCASGFTKFDPTKTREMGFHFGTLPQARDFLKGCGTYRGSSPGIYPVYLSIQNPLFTPDAYSEDPIYFIQWLEKSNHIHEWFPDEDDNYYRSMNRLRDQMASIKADPTLTGADQRKLLEPIRKATWGLLRKVVTRKGYDGIRYRNDNEGLTGEASNIAWIAFSPAQVKSATDNRGTFNRRDPELRNPRRSMIRSKLSRIIEPGDRILDYDRAQGEDLYRLWDLVHTDMPLNSEALTEIEGLLDDDGVLVIQSGEEPSGLRDHFRRATRYNGMLLVQGPMNPEEARINTEKLRRDLE